MTDTSPADIVPLFISVPDAARLLGISEATCWRLVRDKELLSAKIGRSRRVSLEALRHYHDTVLAQTAAAEESA